MTINSIKQIEAQHEAWLKRVRRKPLPTKPLKVKVRCSAHARSTGRPCQMRALKNGRCRLHGGLSTGPRTAVGKARALANLKQFRNVN